MKKKKRYKKSQEDIDLTQKLIKEQREYFLMCDIGAPKERVFGGYKVRKLQGAQ